MRLTTLAIAAGCALAFAPDAQASGEPLRVWSLSKATSAGLGFTQVDGDTQRGGALDELRSFGATHFDGLPGDPRPRIADGRVFSSRSGTTFGVSAEAPMGNVNVPGDSPLGSRAELRQWQSYVKVKGKSSLRFRVTDAVVDAIDSNGFNLLGNECPAADEDSCHGTMEGRVHFDISVYAADRRLYSSGGDLVLRGSHGRWLMQISTASSSQSLFWNRDDFEFQRNIGQEAFARLVAPLDFSVGLRSVDVGEELVVQVHASASAYDRRGRESAFEARFRDPQSGAPVLVETRGLRRTNHPRLHEPPATPVPAPSCPQVPRTGAGRLQFSAPHYGIGEWAGAAPQVLVTRVGGKRGAVSAKVTASDGSAQAGADYRRVSTTVRFADGDASPRLIDVPLRPDAVAEGDETIGLKLSKVRCARPGSPTAAVLTIADDERPLPPTPSFTIGGTVSGLQGSGLVLTHLGVELPVGNGPFAFPTRVAAGIPYDVRVATQPSNPDQVCTVARGAGTVAANVSDIDVACAPPVQTAGLDLGFGGDGKVTTPVGHGQAEAVLIQPDGAIVTVGRSSAGDVDFTLTRHDGSGNLDPGFGAAGIVGTNVGSTADEALDAALQLDGKIVAVGRTGTANRNFGLVRYEADGDPDPTFDGDGIVITDFGSVDQANAVAVQPDGTIVVAGHAATTGPLGTDNDFAAARYEADGDPDPTFGGGDGRVRTDLGTRTDLAHALVLQPDGRIVLVGTVDDDDVALVRYSAAGVPDGTFGSGGIVVTDFGHNEFAKGVALQSDGKILVAGHTLGSGLTTDFALARYRTDDGLDTSFGSGGLVTTDIGGDQDFAEDLHVLPDDRIVIVGTSTSTTISDLAVARYRADGGFERSVTADFHGSGDLGRDVAVQADGKIVAAGHAANGTDTEFALARINP